MATNSKLPASTSAISSYLNRVKEHMSSDASAVSDHFKTPKNERVSVAELTEKLSNRSKKALPPNFFDDTESMSDVVTKAATSSLPSYVAKEIRNIASEIQAKNTQLRGKIKQKRGLLVSTQTQQAERSKQLTLEEKKFKDPSTTLAMIVRQSIANNKHRQKNVLPPDQPVAPITPRKA